jgi:hypothetical protein
VNKNKAFTGALVAAAVTVAGVASAHVPPATDPTVEARRLADRYEAGLAALMKGDGKTYHDSIGGLTDDFLLMAPMGGRPSVAADYPPVEGFERMGRFFRNGTMEQQVLATYATDDMIVLATIERSQVEVGGLPRQPWPLRVTTVFVRRGERWSMAHRHADPLVEGVTLEQAAKLARGEP